MASYAAVVSLMHFLEQILHPSQHRIFLDKNQIQLLYQKVGCLQKFLEDYPHLSTKQTDGLESRMTNVAYAAEDLIESHVLDQIISPSVAKNPTSFFQDVQELLNEMDLIQAKATKIKEMMGANSQPKNSLSNVSAKQALTDQNAMVGFQDELIQIMDKLTGQESNRQIYTITGMGGIGKTTLARNVYDNPFNAQHFDLRAWVTVSQEYSVGEIILALLNEINQRKQESFESDVQLGELLYRSLFNRRYLIVMDDIWSIEAWNEVKAFFPDNSNGSRILITTRLSNVAVQCDSYVPFEMDFLSKEKSWELFCEKVFPQEGCPSELQEIGMNIVQNCRGLPLAIVVIGGLLAKSNKTQEYWEHVAENMNSIINSGNEEHCLKLLSLSYSHLPIHLKPCFLYMATFPEDCEIRVSRLIKLWVAEGFLKPVSGKCLEDVAREYLIDLIDRSLILVRKHGIIGKIKSCIIHDLLRDLCQRESEKENFLSVSRVNSLDILPGIEGARRLSIHRSTRKQSYSPQFLNALRSASFARSMVCEFEWISPWLVGSLRLLRVLDAADKYSPEEILQLVNLRYIAFKSDWGLNSTNFPLSVFWNLQTITLEQMLWNNPVIQLPSEFWDMRQLRHLEFNRVVLHDPPCSRKGDQNSFILENLQTLFTLKDFKFTEDVCRRVPNLKKLKIRFQDPSTGVGMKSLVHLHKLEWLTCRVFYKTSVENLGFPNSLKKLTLSGCELPWKDMSIIGSLPNLEVLKLEYAAFEGSEWYPVEGGFVKLKFLKIDQNHLVYWVAESHHFPCLEYLFLSLRELEEIPAGFGELSTLRLIELYTCSNSAITSAKQILEEQESMGNEDVQVEVTIFRNSEEILSLASENFRVKVLYA